MSQSNESSIKVLSFDFDDTLWPCFPTIINAERQLHQWLSVNVPVIAECYDLYQLRDKRRDLLKAHLELAHDMTALRIRSLEELAAEFDLPDDWIQPAFDVFYAARQQVTLFDDVKPVLDALNQEFIMVSLTNGNANPVMTGISHWFDFSLNAAGVGKLKSEPDIYRQVHERAGIQPAQMVHIGDDPLNDIAGAKSAGSAAIWMNRENRIWEQEGLNPDAEISTLHELTALLKQLF
jgi:putative hydrolase of the HAD superfamily